MSMEIVFQCNKCSGSRFVQVTPGAWEMASILFGWPKGLFGFFHKMALVALSCL